MGEEPSRPLDSKSAASEILKRGYSDDEIANVYSLARWSLENGDVRRAEVILSGVVEIAPNYAPAWLALSYVHTVNKNSDEALRAAKEAVRISPQMPETLLYLISSLLSTGDYNSAGTYLGEVGDQIEGGSRMEPNLIRFYKAQLARYQSRDVRRALSEPIRPRIKSS